MKDPQPGKNSMISARHPRPLAWGRKELRPACLDVSLPRGKVATLGFNCQAHVFVTNHDVLFKPFFHKGVMDFAGSRRMPSDGYDFLKALYDRLFLTGYPVTWKWVSPSPETPYFWSV